MERDGMEYDFINNKVIFRRYSLYESKASSHRDVWNPLIDVIPTESEKLRIVRQKRNLKLMVLKCPQMISPVLKPVKKNPLASVPLPPTPRIKKKSFLARWCPEYFDIDVLREHERIEQESKASLPPIYYNEMRGFRNPPQQLEIFRKMEKAVIIRKDEASIEVLGDLGTSYIDGPKYEIYEGNETNVDFDKRLCVLAECMTHFKMYDRCKRYPLLMQAFNHLGQEMFKLEGEGPTCGSPPSIQVQDNELRYGSVFMGPFGKEIALLLHDSYGDPLLTIRLAEIVGGRPAKGEYDITATENNLLIARLIPRRDHFGERVEPGVFSAEFTRDLALELKVLVIAAGIVMDYHFFD